MLNCNFPSIILPVFCKVLQASHMFQCQKSYTPFHLNILEQILLKQDRSNNKFLQCRNSELNTESHLLQC